MSTLSLWPSIEEDEPLAGVWRGAVSDVMPLKGAGAPEGWREWLETLFPTWVKAGFAEHHAEFWEWVQSIGPDSSPDPFVAVWARGGGKSTGAELAVSKLGLTGCRKYVLYVRGTQDKADTSVGNIGTLLTRDSVTAHYPEHAGKAVTKYGDSRGWRRNRLATKGGFVVDALGLDVAARGAKVDEQRPDLIVFDDIDEKHDSPATTAKKIATITTSILPAGAHNVAVLAIQNLITPDGFFSRMADGRAEYLATRSVSGPHPAVRDLKWEYRDQGPGKPRRAIVTGGTATWGGQDLAVVQRQIDDWSIGSFLVEAQHEVHRTLEGRVLKYAPARHDEDLTDEQCWSVIAQGSVFGGLDFQRWRFGFVLRAVDRQGIVHQIAEYFSQNDDLEYRARVIHALATYYRCPPAFRIWGDSANPTDIAEINRSFRTIGSSLRVLGVGREGKLIEASIERINNELARNAVRYRRDVHEWCWRALKHQWPLLGYVTLPNLSEREPPDVRRWMLGKSAASLGTEVYGSRLNYEVCHWNYPVPEPGHVQESKPDDATADGADCVKADQYGMMSWWKPAKPEDEKPREDRNTDDGLEKLLDSIAKEQQRHYAGSKGKISRGTGLVTRNGNGKR